MNEMIMLILFVWLSLGIASDLLITWVLARRKCAIGWSFRDEYENIRIGVHIAIIVMPPLAVDLYLTARK